MKGGRVVPGNCTLCLGFLARLALCVEGWICYAPPSSITFLFLLFPEQSSLCELSRALTGRGNICNAAAVAPIYPRIISNFPLFHWRKLPKFRF